MKRALTMSVVGIIAAATSCNVLDKKPLDAISDEAVFNDAVFLQNYVYNIYNGIKPPWAPGTGGYDALTDIAVNQPETHERSAGIRNYIEGNMTADNVSDLAAMQDGTPLWNYEYGFIRKANVFFENIEKSSIPADKLDPFACARIVYSKQGREHAVLQNGHIQPGNRRFVSSRPLE